MPKKLNKHEKRVIITLSTFLASCEFAEKVTSSPEDNQKLIGKIYQDLSEHEKQILNMFDKCYDHTKTMLSKETSTIQ